MKNTETNTGTQYEGKYMSRFIDTVRHPWVLRNRGAVVGWFSSQSAALTHARYTGYYVRGGKDFWLLRGSAQTKGSLSNSKITREEIDTYTITVDRESDSAPLLSHPSIKGDLYVN